MKAKKLNSVSGGTIPTKPGIYYLKNKAGKTIYIGKAENLRHRVSAHYQKNAFREGFEKTLDREAKTVTYRIVKKKSSLLKEERKSIAANPKAKHNHYHTPHKRRKS